MLKSLRYLTHNSNRFLPISAPKQIFSRFSTTTTSLPNMSQSEIPTLTYFDIRGSGELPRLVLTAAGVKFNDDRLSFKVGTGFGEDWVKLKPTTPYGQLPNLNVNGVTLAQSAAIIRHISRQHKFEGDSPIDHALIDSGFEHVQDIKKQLYAAKPDAAKLEEFWTKKFPGLVAALNKNVTGSPFFNGNRLSYVDVAIYYLFWVLNTDYPEQVKKALEANPKVQAIYTAVETDPKIAAYLAARPVRPF